MLWWQYVPFHAWPRPQTMNYVQFLVSPGVWYFDIISGGDARCAITKL